MRRFSAVKTALKRRTTNNYREVNDEVFIRSLCVDLYYSYPFGLWAISTRLPHGLADYTAGFAYGHGYAAYTDSYAASAAPHANRHSGHPFSHTFSHAVYHLRLVYHCLNPHRVEFCFPRPLGWVFSAYLWRG